MVHVHCLAHTLSGELEVEQDCNLCLRRSNRNISGFPSHDWRVCMAGNYTFNTKHLYNLSWTISGGDR